MTVCAQGLDPDTEVDRFTDLLEIKEFVDKLGPIVLDAIRDSETIVQLRGNILSSTRAWMNDPRFAERGEDDGEDQ